MHQWVKTCPQCGEDESNEHMIVCKQPKSAYNRGLQISVMASTLRQYKAGQAVSAVWMESVKHLFLSAKDPFQLNFEPRTLETTKKDTSCITTTKQNG